MDENEDQDDIDRAERENEDDLGEMEDTADGMQERLRQNEELGEDVEVPEPGQGEDLSLSQPEDKEAAGVDDADGSGSEDDS